jgi:hypothetical protein
MAFHRPVVALAGVYALVTRRLAAILSGYARPSPLILIF